METQNSLSKMAFEEGVRARGIGLPRTRCPYDPMELNEHSAWLDGYDQGDDLILEKLMEGLR